MRVTSGPARRRRVKKLLKFTKGYRGAKSKNIRQAKQSYMRAGRYGFEDRRRKKREWRRLWILRINAAVRSAGLTYSKFIAGLRRSGVSLDRKQISDLAIKDPKAFDALLALARKSA